MTDFIVSNHTGYAHIRAVSERAKGHLAERNAAASPEQRALGTAAPTIMTGEQAHLALAAEYRRRGFIVSDEG